MTEHENTTAQEAGVRRRPSVRQRGYLDRTFEDLLPERVHLEPSAMKRLRAVRLSMGVSQKELARRAGYAAERVSQWENGHRTPSLLQFQDLAATLGYRVELVLDTGSAESVDDGPAATAD